MNSVAITPDGERVLSASNDKTIRVWKAQSGDLLSTLTGHSHHVISILVMSDGRRALTASADKTIKLWDLDSGLCRSTLKGHSNAVWCVASTNDGKRAISSSQNGDLIYWDLETRESLALLQGHAALVQSVGTACHGRRHRALAELKTAVLEITEDVALLRFAELEQRLRKELTGETAPRLLDRTERGRLPGDL